MTKEQKEHLWNLIESYSSADRTLCISGIYGNYEPEELDEFNQAKKDLDKFMESI